MDTAETRPARPAAPAKQPKATSTLLTDAQALKEAARAVYAMTNQLVIAIKRQRKHSSLTRNALAALKQLQQVEA